jgi:tRNA dimethylallyltransferase
MSLSIDDVLANTEPNNPVLIAGPTASGKSELALRLAETQGGVIINADAIQVFSDWRILTARPSRADEARAPHRLYGHVSGDTPYSTGDWLREVSPFLSGAERPIIVGGTGLYFTALTEGLADIPATPGHIRDEAMDRIASLGFGDLLKELDAETLDRIDRANPMRVQRAWEVLKSTGRGLASWQDATPAPMLPPDAAQSYVMSAPKDWLTPRIERRFDVMMEEGVLDEARANRATWSPDLPSAKAIGAAELMAVLDGTLSKDAARSRVAILTRQFAKRQRTWFRARMRSWQQVDATASAS